MLLDSLNQNNVYYHLLMCVSNVLYCNCVAVIGGDMLP